MKDKINIEKNIPIPRSYNGNYGKWIDTVSRMNVGDSVLLPNKTACWTGMYMAAKRLDRKVSMRRLDKEKIRVWRVK